MGRDQAKADPTRGSRVGQVAALGRSLNACINGENFRIREKAVETARYQPDRGFSHRAIRSTGASIATCKSEAEPETSAHKAPSWANVSGEPASPGPRGSRRQATEVGAELASSPGSAN
ncbi:hypothetical protein Bbelb_094970 [Branchiostoma belcheri]|nr:hypothetical protein Bbelb_094970 [Branchiostoma belcheri]